MITAKKKDDHALRTLLLLGVTVATTLAVLLSVTLLPVSGFAVTSAHAMETTKAAIQVQTRCTSQPNAQNCTGQDPVVQGCDTDAQTLAFKEFHDAQGNLLATLQRRYSPACHSEWGRITDDGREPLQIIIGKTVRSTAGRVAFSTMVFVPNLSVAPEIQGAVSINGMDLLQAGSAGQATTFPALPVVPK